MNPFDYAFRDRLMKKKEIRTVRRLVFWLTLPTKTGRRVTKFLRIAWIKQEKLYHPSNYGGVMYSWQNVSWASKPKPVIVKDQCPHCVEVGSGLHCPHCRRVSH